MLAELLVFLVATIQAHIEGVTWLRSESYLLHTGTGFIQSEQLTDSEALAVPGKTE